MQRIKFTVLITIVFLMMGCGSKSTNGYSDIEELTTDFVDAIKTSNWQEIERINNSVVPDLSSLEYMQSHGFIMEKIVGDKDLDTFITDNRTFH